MKIASYNLRCVYRDDGKNSFIHRLGLIYDAIMREMPDVIAFQEVTVESIEPMRRLFPEYVFFGQFREKEKPHEGLFTALRRETVEPLGFETLWLSPTPYEAGSRFADQSGCPRIAVETKLRYLPSGKTMRLYNLHLDHVSDEAKRLGMQAAFAFADRFCGDAAPSVFLGDFNAKPGTLPITYCEERGYRDAAESLGETFHGYGTQLAKIDYIMLPESLISCVQNALRWEDEHEGIYLSDHYPISVTLDF